MADLDHVKIGDWLVINTRLGRVNEAFLCQITGFTEFGKVIAGRYKFSRDGRQFPNKTPKLIARPATQDEVENGLERQPKKRGSGR
jgi:hypothetical protein